MLDALKKWLSDDKDQVIHRLFFEAFRKFDEDIVEAWEEKSMGAFTMRLKKPIRFVIDVDAGWVAGSGILEIGKEVLGRLQKDTLHIDKGMLLEGKGKTGVCNFEVPASQVSGFKIKDSCHCTTPNILIKVSKVKCSIWPFPLNFWPFYKTFCFAVPDEVVQSVRNAAVRDDSLT